MDFKFYFSLFTRRLPWFLLLLALGSAVGVTLARVLPPLYLAQAKLLVESEQIPDELAASTVQTQATEQLQIIQQRILTRAKLLEMANQLQIYAPTPGRAAQQMNADDIVTDLRERIKIVTTGGGGGRGAVQATLVGVSFEAQTAQLSAAVTNQLVTMILEEDVAMRTSSARQTLDFFQQEVGRLDKELAARGAAILQFKQKNLSALPDSLDFRRSQQAAAQERLLQLDRDVAEVQDRRARMVRLRGAGGEIDPNLSGPTTPEQKQLKILRDQLSNALVVLAPGNPKVVLLKAQIAAQEKIVTAQAASGGGVAEGQELSAYDIQLADLDGQLQFIATQKAEIAATMASLQQSIEATPGNAIALDTLQRDYDNLRAQYDLAVANKARAETGDMIEALAKGQRISVIEQAIAPRDPTSPNRPLIAAAGVGGGLAAGFGLVMLLELLNSAIRRPVDLTAKLGITPFATLPYLRSRGQVRRRRLILSFAFAMALVAIPLGLWLINTQVMPLDLLLNKVMDKFGLAALQSGVGQSGVGQSGVGADLHRLALV